MATVYRFRQGTRAVYEMVVGFRRGSDFGEILICANTEADLIDSLCSDRIPDSWWHYSDLFHVVPGEELTMDVVSNDDTDWPIGCGFDLFANDLHAKLMQRLTPSIKPQTSTQHELSDALKSESVKAVRKALGPHFVIRKCHDGTAWLNWREAETFTPTHLSVDDLHGDLATTIAKELSELAAFYEATASRLRDGKPWSQEDDPQWLRNPGDERVGLGDSAAVESAQGELENEAA